jgi:DNA-binding NtrC family response regulator
MAKLVLIVDDDPAQRRILEETIKRLGYETKSAQGGEQALQILEGPDGAAIALVLLDLVMPGIGGMEVLKRTSQRPSTPPIIVQTANGSIDAAITAMRAGAADFVVKPTSPERLEVSINSALKIEALQGEIARIKKKAEGTLTFADLIIRGQAMQRVIALGRRAAASNIPVLIEGESGVGKELIARAIQGEGERRSKPFITVNCGAIPENLVESILFGHEKGSFTGAVEKRIGKFQEADGGTLFLDEIGDMPLHLQTKLLRVVQEQEFERVGGNRTIQVDVRIVAATNRDLKAMVEENKFRADLYYRLAVFPMNVPPLRERREDIPLLTRYFVQKHAKRMGRNIESIPAHAMEALTTYDWPGNIRELQNVIERSVVLSNGPEFHVALPELDGKSALVALHVRASNVTELSERVRILQVLKETKGMVGGPDGAAARLGLKRTTLQSRMRKYNIARLFQ